MKIILLAITGLMALIGGGLGLQSKSLGATPALAPYQGGTGTSSTQASNVGKYLKVLDDSPFTYEFDTPASGAASNETKWATTSTDITPNVSTAGIIVRASSTLQTLFATTLTVPNLTSALLLTNGSGVFAEYAGSTCGAGTKLDSISALGAVSCSQVDISTFTNLAGDTEIVLTGDALSIGAAIARDTELPIGANPTGTIGLSIVNGAAATFLRSDGAPALSQSIIPTWTGLHIFNTGGLISNASSSIQNFNSASSTLGTLLITGNATGTNAHFSTSIFSALGNFTNSVISSLTLSTLLGAVDAGGATSLEIPNSSNPTVDVTGEFALDTTDNDIIIATSTNASYPGVVRTEDIELFSFKVASTSQAYASSSMVLPSKLRGFLVTGIMCFVEGGTSVVVNLSDANGANDTNAPTCTQAKPTSATVITANTTWTAGEETRLEWGTKTGAIDHVNIVVIGTWTRS